MTEATEDKGLVKAAAEKTKGVASNAWETVKNHPGGATVGAVIGSVLLTPVIGIPVGGWLGAYISKKNS